MLNQVSFVSPEVLAVRRMFEHLRRATGRGVQRLVLSSQFLGSLVEAVTSRITAGPEQSSIRGREPQGLAVQSERRHELPLMKVDITH
jgi:hypothetical protein